MDKIAIVTDSLADVPEDLVKTYGIYVVPLTINIDGVSYKDGIDITKEEFYKLVEEGKMPTTSQVSPVEFMDVFNDLLKSYDYIIAIILSSKLSGTYQSAEIAKGMVNPSRIQVFDSLQYSFGNGIIVLEAAKMASQGASKEEIIARVQEMIKNVRYIMSFDSLDYLYRGGRLARSQAFLGNILNIKPIVMNEDGEIKIVDKVRGQKNVIKWIVNYMKKTGIDFTEKEVGVLHTDKGDFINEVETALRNELGITKFIRGRGSCSTGTHAGPAAIGVFFEEKK
ncbi:MAG: DegV family protein [Thermoanaerobacteraceae bacterium]